MARVKEPFDVQGDTQLLQIRQEPTIVTAILGQVGRSDGAHFRIDRALVRQAQHVLKAHDEKAQPRCKRTHLVERSVALQMDEEWMLAENLAAPRDEREGIAKG